MTSLSAGYSHACGVTTSGVVQCWGGNANGQLGDNTIAPRSVPAPIASSLTFTAVAAGDAHTCALASGGDVYCWGSDGKGQLGDGNQVSNITTPIKVVGGLSFASISAGGYHTCGVTVGGDAYCWGSNATGQLGDSSLTDRLTPSRVAGGLKFTSISAGESHTCGVASDGKAYCWGDDKYGQLGFGTPTAQKATPTAVAAGLPFLALSAGGFHTCGIASDSSAWCWGDNSTGELGVFPSNNGLPSAVAGGLLFKAILLGVERSRRARERTIGHRQQPAQSGRSALIARIIAWSSPSSASGSCSLPVIPLTASSVGVGWPPSASRRTPNTSVS